MSTKLRTALPRTPRADSRSFLSLTRITSGGNFIPEIDGLRFIAIASVVAFHIYEYLRIRVGIPQLGFSGTALSNGQRGVPLFFVISGFILGRPFAMHHIRGFPAPQLKAFYLRRVTRLEPPYIIAIVGVFAALAVFANSRGISHLIASLLYSHNLIYGAPNPFFGLAWSLEIEVQFYCLIPFLAIVYKLPRSWRRAFLLTFMFMGALHLLPLPARINLSILGWIQCFAAGLLLADLYADGWNQQQHWIFDLLSIVLWPAVFLLNDPLAVVFLPWLALILFVSAFRSIVFHKLFTIPAVVIIGGMCYTIYLVHYPVLSFSGHFFKSSVALIIGSLVSIAVVSLLFFVFIERPCMDKNWPSRLLGYRPMQKNRAE
jgi:peptidoglycan/LPS O-acetylase OafA/YrhL